MELKNLSSNWRKLQETLKKSDPPKPRRPPPKRAPTDFDSSQSSSGQNGVKRRRISTSSTKHITAKSTDTRAKKTEAQHQQRFKRRRMSTGAAAAAEVEGGKTGNETTQNSREPGHVNIVGGAERVNEGLSSTVEAGKYIAIDCEMVGVGPNPENDSVLARVSMVNYNGDQIYDSFVQPKETVTDWRTHVSGVSPKHMENARTFEDVQNDIASLMDGRILVGHAVRNDLDALLLGHPKRVIRDTSKHPAYRKFAAGGSPRLKVLAAELLGLEIQGAAHSSVEDARTTMMLFRRDKEAFDREHAKKWPVRVPIESEKPDGRSSSKKKKKKKTKK